MPGETDSSASSTTSHSDFKLASPVDSVLNKPLPPIKDLEISNVIPTKRNSILHERFGGDQSSRPDRQPNDARPKMSLFNLFSKPKVERLRGYAEPGLAPPSVPIRHEEPFPYGTGPIRQGPPTKQNERTPPGSRHAPTQGAHPAADGVYDQHTPPQRRRVDDGTFDTHHPPAFKQIFSLAVKIGPAHTLSGGAGTKSNAAWKAGSTLSLGDGLDQWDRPSSRRSSRIQPVQGTPLTRKIFTLTRNGHLLQYADRGPSERLPEQIQRLTKETCAIASDLVPGRPYTLQVIESGNVQDSVKDDSSSLLKRIGLKHGPPKRAMQSTLIVLDTAKELEEWLFAIRKEIQKQSKTASPGPSPPRMFTPSPEKRLPPTRTPPRQMQSQRLNGNEEDMPMRMDSARQRPESRKGHTMTPTPRRVAERPQSPEMDDDDEDALPTVAQLYHQQVKLTQQDDTTSVTSGHPTTLGRRSMQSMRAGSHTSDATTAATSIMSTPTKLGSRQSSESRMRPFSPPSNSNPIAGFAQRQPSLPDSAETASRNDSLAPLQDRSAQPSLAEREAARLARIRKRASLQSPSAGEQERPALRSVSSLGRMRQTPPVVDEGPTEPPPLPPTMSTQPMTRQRQNSNPPVMVPRAVMENDEYHAFQQSMSGHAPKNSISSQKSRRHSAMPNQPTSSRQKPSLFHTNTDRAGQMNGNASETKKLPPRLPFKLRPNPNPNNGQAAPRSFSASSAVGAPSSNGPIDKRSGAQVSSLDEIERTLPKPRRPTSMSAQSPSAQPNQSSKSSAPAQQPSNQSRRNFLRPDFMDRRNRQHLRPPSHISEGDSDDGSMLPIQNTTDLDLPSGVEMKATVDGPMLPILDFGMPVVALAPPPPPPATPLPRLPPTLPSGRSYTPQLAGR